MCSLVFGRTIIAQQYFFHKIKNNYIVSFQPFSVTKSFDADAEAIGPITLLSNGSIVFNAQKQGLHKLKQYNLRTGAEMISIDVPEVCALSPVKLNSRSSLAVSFL